MGHANPILTLALTPSLSAQAEHTNPQLCQQPAGGLPARHVPRPACPGTVQRIRGLAWQPPILLLWGQQHVQHGEQLLRHGAVQLVGPPPAGLHTPEPGGPAANQRAKLDVSALDWLSRCRLVVGWWLWPSVSH